MFVGNDRIKLKMKLIKLKHFFKNKQINMKIKKTFKFKRRMMILILLKMQQYLEKKKN